MHKCMGCGSGWGTVVAQQTDVWANQDETSMFYNFTMYIACIKCGSHLYTLYFIHALEEEQFMHRKRLIKSRLIKL